MENTKKSNVLSLGTVKLGMPDYGFSSDKNNLPFDPVVFLKNAERKGICSFDTSPRYGKSEEVLGRYILQAQKNPFVSSKIDNLSPGNHDTPKIMLASVRNSLLKLHLKQLDVCYIHQSEMEIIADPYVHEGLALLKQQKLIRYAGAGLYTFQECEYALTTGLFEYIQIPVSIFDLTYFNQFVSGKKNSVHFVARSLLLQGILVNRKGIIDRIRQSQPILNYLDQLDQVAEECGLSTLELALAFVFSLQGINNFLIGTTSVKNLEMDIACLNLKLPPRAFSRVFDMASEAKAWTNPRNWK